MLLSLRRDGVCAVGVNARDQMGWTAVMFAVERGNIDVVRMLLALMRDGVYDVDVNARSRHGMTALMLAVEKGYMSVALKIIESRSAYVASNNLALKPSTKLADSQASTG